MAALTVTTQVPVPLHAPPQPPNVEPAAAVAVSVNCAPGVTDSEQSDPHEIPAGALVTVPDPRGTGPTVRVAGAASWGNGGMDCQSRFASANEPVTFGTCVSPLPSRFMM